MDEYQEDPGSEWSKWSDMLKDPENLHYVLNRIFGEGTSELPIDEIDKKCQKLIAILIRERCGEISFSDRIKMLDDLGVRKPNDE